MAQTNLGYNYIGKSLEVLNIEPGAYSEKYITAMDEKVNYYKERKTTKEFKRRRHKLSKQNQHNHLERKQMKESHTHLQ